MYRYIALLLLHVFSIYFTFVNDASAGFIVAAVSAIATGLGGIMAAGGIGAIFLKGLIYVGISLGASLLQKALMKQPNNAESAGAELNVQMGDDVPISFIMGRFATAGKRKYIGVWGEEDGTPNAYLVDVVEYSNLPQSGTPKFWAGEEKVTVDLDNPHPDGRGYPVVEYRDDDGDDFMWIKWYTGAQTVADPYLLSKFAADERPFFSSMIGTGTSYAIFTCRYHDELYSGGLPGWMIETDSIPLYDLRKDSTNGGSGSHRWNDPTTWEASNNPIVIIYNIIRGVKYGSQWMYGGQNVGAHRLPASNWIAAANACDVVTTDGTNEPSYRTGLEVTGDTNPIDIIQQILTGCNARMSEVGGYFKVHVGAPDAAVYGITDENIVVTNEQQFDPFPTLDNTYNGIEADYPEPAEKWQSKNAPPRYMTDLEAEDGNRRLAAAVSFPTVPYSNQVQRVMTAMIKDYRRFRTHQFYLSPEAYALEPNDVISWTSERNGYDNKYFTIVSVESTINFLQLVTIKEVDPSDYDWGSADLLPTATGWIGKITPPPQTVSGWVVEPWTIYDSDGDPRRPAIKVSVDGGIEGVDYVWIQARLAESGEVIFDNAKIKYASPYSWILDNSNILPNEDYEVRAQFVSGINANQVWSDWLPVTTPNVLFDIYKDIDLDQIIDDINVDLDWITFNTRELIEQARIITNMTVDQDSANYTDKQQIRREITSTQQGITAAYTEAITVATGPNSAIALKLEELEAKIDDDVASAINLLQTDISNVQGQVTANANSITQLSTEVDGIASSVTVRGQAQSGPSGWSRYGVQVKTGSGSTWSTAAFFMDVSTSGTSRFAILADQFVIQDSSNNSRTPFVFQSGVATMNVANIGTVTAGILQSSDGKVVFNLNTKLLTFSD